MGPLWEQDAGLDGSLLIQLGFSSVFMLSQMPDMKATALLASQQLGHNAVLPASMEVFL